MDFAKSTVENFIINYGGDDIELMKDIEGCDVWILQNGITIKLPSDNSRIPEAQVSLISEVKLDLHQWEYDYWLGNNTPH